MRTPTVSLVAYEDRKPCFVFVAVPNERGRYLRTDTSVIMVPCSQCGAQVAEPCHNSGKGAHLKYHVNTHYARRQAADRRSLKHTAVKPRYRLVDGIPTLISEGI